MCSELTTPVICGDLISRVNNLLHFSFYYSSYHFSFLLNIYFCSGEWFIVLSRTPREFCTFHTTNSLLLTTKYFAVFAKLKHFILFVCLLIYTYLKVNCAVFRRRRYPRLPNFSILLNNTKNLVENPDWNYLAATARLCVRVSRVMGDVICQKTLQFSHDV